MAKTFHDLLLRYGISKLLLKYLSTNDIAFLLRSSRKGNTEIESQILKQILTLTRAQCMETNFEDSYLYKWICAYSKNLMRSRRRDWVQLIYRIWCNRHNEAPQHSSPQRQCANAVVHSRPTSYVKNISSQPASRIESLRMIAGNRRTYFVRGIINHHSSIIIPYR